MSGKKVDNGMTTDNQFHAIPVGNEFTTEKKTLSGTSYESVTVPSNAVEVDIYSSTEFYVAGENTEDGFPITEKTLGIGNTTTFYVKGSASQDIYFLWKKI